MKKLRFLGSEKLILDSDLILTRMCSFLKLLTLKINFNLGPTSLIKDMLNWILRKLPNTKQVLIPYTLHPLLHHNVTCPTMSNSTKTRDIRIFAHMMVTWFGPSLTTKVKLLKLSSKSSFFLMSTRRYNFWSNSKFGGGDG